MGIYMRIYEIEILFTSTISMYKIYLVWGSKYFKRWLPFLLHLSVFVGSFKLITLCIEYAGEKTIYLSVSVGEAETPILIMFNIFLTEEIFIRDKLWEEIGGDTTREQAGWHPDWGLNYRQSKTWAFSWQFKYSYSSQCDCVAVSRTIQAL